MKTRYLTCTLLLVFLVGCPNEDNEAKEVHLIEFYADDCALCERQRAIVDHLRQNYQHVQFRELHVLHDAHFAQRYGVEMVPTIVLLVNGEVAKRWVGLQEYDSLARELNRYPQAELVNPR